MRKGLDVIREDYKRGLGKEALMPASIVAAFVHRTRCLVLLIVVILVACGTSSTTSSGNAVEPVGSAVPAVPTATLTGKSNIAVPSSAPASAPSGSPIVPAASVAPALPGVSPLPSALASSLPSSVPAASAAGSDPAPPAPSSSAPGPAPSVAPPAAPSVAPASAVPAPAVAPQQQTPSQIPAQDGKCPDSYPWAAYIGPAGQKWYRNPQSVAIFYRQPPTLCFLSEAAAQAVGYSLDPRPARATKSQDGTCPSDNPVKGFTSAQGKQVYLLPTDPGYAGQKATDCFSDDGVAQYYGFEHVRVAAPSAGPKPSSAPAPSASARPSNGPAPSASPKPSSAPAGGNDIPLSPATLDFGTVTIGAASPVAKIALTNNSHQSIEVKTLDIRLTGANADNFSVKFEGCTDTSVKPGGTCTYDITFRPIGSPGTRTAQFSISTGAGPSTTTTLKGVAK
jgi:hypothetical protein